jgi:D-hexose-6-phosphate mutarotase
MEVRKRCLTMRIEDLYQQHICINPALIQEKGISLYEAEKVELNRRKLLKRSHSM